MTRTRGAGRVRREAARLCRAALCLALWSSPVAAEVIHVGAAAGPAALILEKAAGVAAGRGLDVRISAYAAPGAAGAALAEGAIDAASLPADAAPAGGPVVALAPTILCPLGLYSRRLTHGSDLPAGATIAISDDPRAGGRALRLLAAHGLIALRPGAGARPTVLDIAANPRRLHLIEAGAGAGAGLLDMVTAAVLDPARAAAAGLGPPLLREPPEGAQAGVLAVRAADRDRPWVATLVASYHSPAVRDFIAARFGGDVLAAW